MRTGISITVNPSERKRLKAILRDRNAPQKHVWRAEIVLLSAEDLGTNEIMRSPLQSVTEPPYPAAGGIAMRAEIQQTVEQVQQAVTLLRRHL
jgi:hypothetical protein